MKIAMKISRVKGEQSSFANSCEIKRKNCDRCRGGLILKNAHFGVYWNVARAETVAEAARRQRGCLQWSDPRAFFRQLAKGCCGVEWNVRRVSCGVARRLLLFPIPAGTLRGLCYWRGVEALFKIKAERQNRTPHPPGMERNGTTACSGYSKIKSTPNGTQSNTDASLP